MAKSSVICILQSRPQAEIAVQQLTQAGFLADDISVLFPDRSTSKDFAHEKSTKAPEGATIGVGAGGAVGATIGLLAGMGTIAIPGLGPFIAAGPLLAALSGAAAGAAVGGITGALVGMGFPEYEAKRYEGKVKDGNILLSVHVENGDEGKRATDILKNAGAQDIATAGEAAAPAPRESRNP